MPDIEAVTVRVAAVPVDLLPAVSRGPCEGCDFLKPAPACEVMRARAVAGGLQTAKLSDHITLSEEDFFYQEGEENAFLLFNPPYDERLKEKDICDFYSHIGDKLKHAFPGCTAWILSGHIEAMKHIGLKPSKKYHLLNGSIPSLFARFDMYAGSKKQKWKDKYGDQQS